MGSESVIFNQIVNDFLIELNWFKQGITFFQAFALNSGIETLDIGMHSGSPRVGEGMLNLQCFTGSMKTVEKFTPIITVDHPQRKLAGEKPAHHHQEIFGVAGGRRPVGFSYPETAGEINHGNHIDRFSSKTEANGINLNPFPRFLMDIGWWRSFSRFPFPYSLFEVTGAFSPTPEVGQLVGFDDSPNGRTANLNMVFAMKNNSYFLFTIVGITFFPEYDAFDQWLWCFATIAMDRGSRVWFERVEVVGIVSIEPFFDGVSMEAEVTGGGGNILLALIMIIANDV